MPVDARELGQRLRTYRQSAGLTQADAAAQIGVSRTTLVAIESGDRPIRPDELVRAAEAYDVSTNALLRREAIHVDLVAQFRKSGAPDTASSQAVRTLHRLSASYVELERAVGTPMVMRYPPPTPLPRRSQVEQTAEDLAMHVRSTLGLGISPIPDVIELLEHEVGMRIFFRPLDSQICGAFAFHEELGGCVLINANHPRPRRALTAVHEFGHLLTTRDEPEVLHLQEGGPLPVSERLATLFAISFLMPGAAVRKRFQDSCDRDGRFAPRHVILLADVFHVSLEAMTRRLEQLELLPQGTFESLRRRGLSRETVERVLGPREDVGRPPLVPRRLALLAVEAHERGLFTEGQLSEALDMDRVAIRELVDSLGSLGED